MEPEDSMIAATAREYDVATAPKLVPGPHVATQKFGLVGHPPHPRKGLGQRLADGAIARGMQGDGLLDVNRGAQFQVDLNILARVARRGAGDPAG